MTLIVGVKCKDGIVIGADGAATYGGLGNRTIIQPTRKLTIVNGRVIVGVSGAVGLAQRIVGIIEHLETDPKEKETFSSQNPSFPRKPCDAMVKVREKLAPHLMQELNVCAQAQAAIGPNVAQSSAIALTVLAVPIQGNPCLFQFDQQGAPEAASNDLPFVAIGSGQAIADPFLAFIRRIFWPPGTVPNLGDGIFAVAWTLQHAIKTHPGGVADPVQIATLVNGKAKELSREDLQEHYENIGVAENALKNYKTSLTGNNSSNVNSSPMPTPPKGGTGA